MPGNVRVGGAWKSVSGVSTRIGGTWKTVSSGWTRIGGAWKQWFTAGVAESTTLAVAHATSPFISVYPWSSGFGTKFSDPASLPAGTGRDVEFSPSKAHIAIAHFTSPYVTAYPWSSSGFGTKYADPSTLPAGDGQRLSFSPSGNDIAVGGANSPYINVYAFSSGFGTRYSNPATLPTGTLRGVSFSPSGTVLAVGDTTTNNARTMAWSWSSSGFGTKFADSASDTGGFGVGFHPDENAIAMGNGVGIRLRVYSWSSGFGTKFSDPATLPSGLAFSTRFSPAGDYLTVSQENAPGINVYPWSNGFGTRYADPAVSLATSLISNFSATGNNLAIGQITASSRIFVFPWSSSGFGTKYADPATIPTGTAPGNAWA
jgi:hypothetical protein